MLSKTSRNFREFFITEFTKEIIRNSKTGSILNLQNIVNKKEIEEKEKIILPQKTTPLILLGPVTPRTQEQILEPIKITVRLPPEKKTFLNQVIPIQKKPVRMNPPNMRFQEVTLPPQARDIRPNPVDVPIDLGILNPLINNLMIQTIECSPEENVIVTGRAGRKKTDIILTKEEVDIVIENFSEIAKIPIQEGFFKVAVGKLILSAIISGTGVSRFIIRKMISNPMMIGRR
ncbi:MAG: hypothetical protein AABW81_00115 [Nanoarchaeota archaeon]